MRKKFSKNYKALTEVKVLLRRRCKYKNGRSSVTDEPRPGRPTEISESKSEDSLSIILNERHITIRQLAERLNISYGTVQSKLKELGIRKLASRFVPRFLSGEMMDNRLASCEEFCELYEKYGNSFLQNILKMKLSSPCTCQRANVKALSGNCRMRSHH